MGSPGFVYLLMLIVFLPLLFPHSSRPISCFLLAITRKLHINIIRSSSSKFHHTQTQPIALSGINAATKFVLVAIQTALERYLTVLPLDHMMFHFVLAWLGLAFFIAYVIVSDLLFWICQNCGTCIQIGIATRIIHCYMNVSYLGHLTGEKWKQISCRLSADCTY